MSFAIALTVHRVSLPATKRRESTDRWSGGGGPRWTCSPPGGHPGRGRPGRTPARLRFSRPVRLGRHRRPWPGGARDVATQFPRHSAGPYPKSRGPPCTRPSSPTCGRRLHPASTALRLATGSTL